MIQSHMHRLKLIDFMVVELCLEEDKEHGENYLGDITHVSHNWFLYTGYFSHILHLDIIKSEIKFKLKVKMNKILIYGFQWG